MPTHETSTPKINSTSEVLAYCGSCKMDLAATIVAKVGSKIVKVQCKTCKKERAYKAAKGVTNPGDAAPATKRAPKEKKEEARGVSVEVEWTRLMKQAEASKKVKYSPKTILAVGDVVEHPSFGEGIVMRLIHPDKAEILFRTDVKVLIHSRK